MTLPRQLRVQRIDEDPEAAEEPQGQLECRRIT